ncbi:2,4-dienoyl-CoA reductase-like NADH-dependent reductase (Old Yellow Enzyme family) [Humitalea rosea]|uniref:2,4-dienoyl-CoA reductase-like NADH-dependent reductase (Old Yellow Enzyme family) n=1 Tax=Humitalea rosea TaxID=990373 RepID=A0A2W7HUQ7_9PROT|nr:NADH:flavin oxidoreductase/NADH oxidase [Humitalea rosea]PZW37740.1 2,4-dienoyl-CoA reductase-like NADH-dependent reductase (Old Yellow Enzyme family) [Humitalea rosea]
MQAKRPAPLLFTPLTLRALTVKNRVVISPMCQHAADADGSANDWHLVHLGKFALGGAGLIFTEGIAVSPHGRIGLRDLGLWSDAHVAPLRRVVEFVHGQGAAIGAQLAHAGRKAGSHALWDGGAAFTAAELAAAGMRRLGPSSIAAGPEWTVPETLDASGIIAIVESFVAAARRADAAGFDAVELHFGHGYLVPSFLSPLSNHREDGYGCDRMLLAREIAAAVRAVWPKERPLFVRISAVDGAADSWGLDDSVVLARDLARIGVDVIDVSSGGLSEETRRIAIPRGLGFQLDYAATIRREAGVTVQAVGMIVDGPQAEAALRDGAADLIAVGREALRDPYWAHHAAEQLGGRPAYETWPVRHGAWLLKREEHMGDILRARRAYLHEEAEHGRDD